MKKKRPITTFKIQVSLATNMPTPMVLAYNKNRNIEGQFPVTDEILKLMDGRFKAFFACRVRPDGKLEVIAEVEDPGW